MKKISKILLSHQNVPPEQIDEFAKNLEESECEVKISELEEESADLTEEEIEERSIVEEIEECELVFVLIGSVEEENLCVRKEIEEADRQDKIVVGVYMGGGSESIPPALENSGSGLIINDIVRITSVLQGNPVPWETPAGTPRKPTKTIDKPDC